MKITMLSDICITAHLAYNMLNPALIKLYNTSQETEYTDM